MSPLLRLPAILFIIVALVVVAPGVPLARSAAAIGGPTGDAAADPTAERATGRPTGEALDGLATYVERAMAELDVPGLAVAVVGDAGLLWAEGFGRRDLGADLPVTTETVFAIGSCTKPYTAVLLGTLVDEGRLEWSRPVRAYLPELRLVDRCAEEQLTLVDMLAHRSGLPRHDAVWYGAQLPRGELVRRLRFLEPSAGFREGFQYNNLMYVAAGMVAERVTGTTWEELMRQRIIEPLGLQRTTLAIVDGAADARRDVARPYVENAVGEPVPLSPRRLDAVAPAGAINSSVLDVGRWLSMNLAHGALDGRRVITDETLQEIHAPRVVVPDASPEVETPLTAYGLGWQVQPYRGHSRLTHVGSVDGFSAVTTILPGDGLGVVVLANLDRSPVTRIVEFEVLDRLLGLPRRDRLSEALALRAEAPPSGSGPTADEQDPDRRAGTQPSHPLDRYAGRYEHPAYGVVRITLDGPAERLVLDYHGLKTPLTHYHYDVFQMVRGEPLIGEKRVEFTTDLRGFVASLKMELEPAVAAIEFSMLPPERLGDPGFLAGLEGDYRLDGLTLTVLRRGDQLFLAVPGRGEFALVPYRDDRFDLEGRDNHGVEFDVNDTGQAVSLELIEPRGRRRAVRIVGATAR